MVMGNKTHEQRITRLEELVKDGVPPALAADIVGLSQEEVRTVLRLDDDVELTNEAILAALVRHAASMERSRATHGAGISRAHEELKDHSRRLADVEMTIDEIVEHLDLHGVEAVKSDVDQGMSLRSSLMTRGLTEDEIRIMLGARDEMRLSDADFVMVFVNRISLVESRVDHLEQRVAPIEAAYGANGENLVTRDNVREVVTTTIEERSRFPMAALVVAIVVGLIAGLLWWAHDFGDGSTVLVPGGTRSLNAWADEWWAAWLFGIAIGAIVYGVGSLMSNSTSTTEETTVDDEEPARPTMKDRLTAPFNHSRRTNEPNARFLSEDERQDTVVRHEHPEDTVVESHDTVPADPHERTVHNA